MTASLPLWADCRKAVLTGAASPLQRFIYNHEPADGHGDAEFRADLAAALEAQFPADLKADLKNHLFGIYDPQKPTPSVLIARIEALP